MTIEIPIDIEGSLKQVVSEVVKPLFKEIERLKDEVVALRENNGDLELLDKAEVARQLKITKTTLDTKIRENKFPKPDLYLGPQSPRWRKNTLEKFLKEQR